MKLQHRVSLWHTAEYENHTGKAHTVLAVIAYYSM